MYIHHRYTEVHLGVGGGMLDIVPTFCYRVDTERDVQGAVGQKKSEGMLWGNKVVGPWGDPKIYSSIVHTTSLCFLLVKRSP